MKRMELGIVLETERLLLRPWRVSDSGVQLELWSERDPRVPAHRRIDCAGRPTVQDLADRICGSHPGASIDSIRGGLMATITVRDLPDDVQRRLKQQAAVNGRSMEAEARAILSAAVSAKGFSTAWLEMAAKFRGGDELRLPTRSQPRSVDFG